MSSVVQTNCYVEIPTRLSVAILLIWLFKEFGINNNYVACFSCLLSLIRTPSYIGIRIQLQGDWWRSHSLNRKVQAWVFRYTKLLITTIDWLMEWQSFQKPCSMHLFLTTGNSFHLYRVQFWDSTVSLPVCLSFSKCLILIWLPLYCFANLYMNHTTHSHTHKLLCEIRQLCLLWLFVSLICIVSYSCLYWLLSSKGTRFSDINLRVSFRTNPWCTVKPRYNTSQ